MSCKTFEVAIYEIACERMVDAELRKQALDHCEACISCARTLSEQRELTRSLRPLEHEFKGVEAPERVWEVLTRALNLQSPLVVRSRRPHWIGFGAIAATLAVVIGGFTMRWWSQQTIEKAGEAGSALADAGTKTPEAHPPPAIEIRKESSPAPKPRRVKRSRPTRQPGKAVPQPEALPKTEFDYGREEIATEFLPLSHGNALGLQEGGQIIRVEVPRSTLVSFGLPVNLDRVGQRVKADLLLGADGSAQAIRFVQ